MKHTFFRGIALLLIFSFGTSACGTIIHGTRQRIMINSDPQGATAQVDGLEIQTPNSVSLSRTKDYVVEVEKKGCEKKQAQITRSFNGIATILGNILWLVAGVLVDILAGGAWTLEPDPVNVTLSCSPDKG